LKNICQIFRQENPLPPAQRTRLQNPDIIFTVNLALRLFSFKFIQDFHALSELLIRFRNLPILFIKII
jgi:hypothetical protein